MKPLSGHHRKARQWGKKDDKLREQAEQAWVQARTRATAFRRGAVKSGASARNKLYRATHGEIGIPKPSLSKGKAILLLVLLGIGIIVSVDQYLKVKEVQASIYGGERKQPLWVGSNDLNGWNCRLASNPTANRIKLDSNTTHTSWCITKSSIDLSVASGKTLGAGLSWFPFTNPGTYPSQWGWYLTRNATGPTELSDYNPLNDKNVALLVRHNDNGAGVEFGVVFAQKNTGDAMSLGELAGCAQGGTAFICDTGDLPDNTTEPGYSELRLNYTGNIGSANAVSYLFVGETPLPPPLGTTTTILPWFQFQAQPYFVGFYERPRSPDPIAIEWYFPPLASDPDGHIFYGTPLPSTASPPTQGIDTGGFFGPIIRALISVGLFILQSIANFLGWVADIFVTAMNAVGAFFGLGNVGTAIRDFLTGVSNFIINVVTTVFGWGVTFASLFQNGISFIANFLSGSNGFIAWIVSFFTSIAGLWTIIQDVWNALNTAVFTMNQILVVWYLVGMFWVYMDGWPGFKNWIDLTDTFIIKLLRGAWWTGREVTQVVLDVKRFLAQWL